MASENYALVRFGRSVSDGDLQGLQAHDDVVEALRLPDGVNINININTDPDPFHVLDRTFQVEE